MPTFMNRFEVIAACDRYREHPIMGPATQTLLNLMEAVDDNSDGWPYWQAPQKASARLRDFIADGERAERTGGYTDPEYHRAALRRAYTPLKAFRTRSNLRFEIVSGDAK